MNAEDRYFGALVQLLCGDNPCRHMKLLKALDNVEYIPMCGLDSNRVADGISLRTKLAGTTVRYGVSYASVLEVLAALSNRIETSILSDFVDDPGRLFWRMMINMGLSEYNDDVYDSPHVYSIIDAWLRGEYNDDGSGGGPFIIQNPRAPLQGVELWYQANWYIAALHSAGLEPVGLPEYKQN